MENKRNYKERRGGREKEGVRISKRDGNEERRKRGRRTLQKTFCPPPDGTSARRNSSARSESSPQSAARKESEMPLKAPQEPCARISQQTRSKGVKGMRRRHTREGRTHYICLKHQTRHPHALRIHSRISSQIESGNEWILEDSR
jgi:hypothetical protein